MDVDPRSSQYDSSPSQYDPQYNDSYSDSAEYNRGEFLKKFKIILVVLLIPIAIAAAVFSILVIVHQSDRYDISQDFSEISSYFPSLDIFGDGIAVRVSSEDCDANYCPDPIYCEEKGAMRIEENGGDALCVCDGTSWQCDSIGRFCESNPVLPVGAEILDVKGCTNTPSSQTCKFTCEGSLIPSGEFTCIDGHWDTQHCVCSATDLQTLFGQMNIFGVSHIEGCDLIKSGEKCHSWDCEGFLNRLHGAKIGCGTDGWHVTDSSLCGCQSNILYATLAMGGVDYIDVTNCDDTPAGRACDHTDWSCPHNLHQQGEFECDEKDGSWHVYQYPCICSDGYAEVDIIGFEQSCGYLNVGQSCDYDSWECESPLIPITALECTTDGLKGECGCSDEELANSLPPPDADADITDCNKTPIGELCTDWTCETSNKLCCNSPRCNEDGTWTVLSDMCETQTALGCDPSDLIDYGPLCDVGTLQEECSITCATGSDPVFACQDEEMTCLATCEENGGWDVPCVCNISTLSKKVLFATSTTVCGIGEECDDVICTSNATVVPIVCDPWIGYTGECGCQPLSEVVDCEGVACDGFDPWGCESYKIGSVCLPSEYCVGGFVSPFDALICSGKSWVTETDELSELDDALCGCSTENICDAIGEGGSTFCSESTAVIVAPGNVTCPFFDTNDECGFDCSEGVYTGGQLSCDLGGAITCNEPDTCTCCGCDSSVCTSNANFQQVICANPSCTTQVLANGNSSSNCPSGTSYVGACTRINSCSPCSCQSSTCNGATNATVCTSSGSCSTMIVFTPETCPPNFVAIGTCEDGVCIPI